MNFHLKECMDWNSQLVKVNCYRREHRLHLLDFMHITALWLMHSNGRHRIFSCTESLILNDIL